MRRLCSFITVFALSIVTVQAGPQTSDDMIQAISDAAAYRSHAEAIAQRAKTQYNSTAREYQVAQALYNNARQQNNAFIEAAVSVLGGSTPDRTLTDSAATATIAANDYVTQLGPLRRKTDKGVIALLPPFVRLLLAVLFSLHLKSGSALVAEEISTQLMWNTWEEL